MLSGNVRGAIWLTAAGLMLTIANAAVKTLGADLPTIEILFFRGVFGLLMLLPFVMHAGFRSVATGRPWMHVLRSAVGIGSMFGLYYAVAHMPLADATAIIFSSPLFATIFAFFILHEAVGWRRATATALGFVGILVMIRPGTAAFDPIALIAVASALLTGALAIIIKKLSGADRPGVIVFWFTLGGTVISTVPTVLTWQTPAAHHWPLLAAVGLLGLLGQIAFTRAFSVGESSAVAPFDYLRLIFAGIIGYVVFAEIPDTWSFAGAFIIVASTLYIIRREARLARARKAAALALAEQAGGGPTSEKA